MAVKSELYRLRSMSAPEIAKEIQRLASQNHAVESRLRELISADYRGLQLIHLCLLAVLLDDVVDFPDAAIRGRRCAEIESAAVQLNLRPELVRVASRQARDIVGIFDS